MENEDKVAIYCESDSICIVYPFPDCGLSLEEIIQRSIPTGTKYIITSKSDLPESRLYRDAWILKSNKIEIDLEKAKEIQKNYIRQVRDKLLKNKDIEYMRALESNNDSKILEITNQKNALRDITKIVDNFTCDSKNPNIITNKLSQVWNSSILGQNPYIN